MVTRKLCARFTAALALFLAVSAGSAQAAENIYMKIKGQKQGEFKAESKDAQSGRISALKFDYQVVGAREAGSGMATGREASSGQSSGQASTAHQPIKIGPRDAATGRASGKRQHGAIKIVKEWGAASPQFMQAASSGEVLTDVEILFVRTGADGKEEVYKRIRMTEVMVSAIRSLSGGDRPTQEVTFEADTQNIQFLSRDGKTMASDDWMVSK